MNASLTHFSEVAILNETPSNVVILNEVKDPRISSFALSNAGRTGL
jgi:hypothetical protein